MTKSDIRLILGLDLPPIAKLAIIACLTGAGKHEIEKYYSIQKLVDSEIIEKSKTRYHLTPKFCEMLGLDHALPIQVDAPDSRVRDALQEYRNLYIEHWEEDPTKYWSQNAWGKNSKNIKELLAKLDTDFPDPATALLFLKRAMRAYIYDEDEWLHQKGYPLNIMISRFQQYMLQLKKTKANQERLVKKYPALEEKGLSWLEEKKIEEKRLARPSDPNTTLAPIGPVILEQAKKFGIDLKLFTGDAPTSGSLPQTVKQSPRLAVLEDKTAHGSLRPSSSTSELKPPPGSGTI